MTQPPHHKDDALLAAEYVLGVLDAAERAEAAARLNDPAFAQLVEEWEKEFAHYADQYELVAPPAHLHGNIKARLFGPETSFWTFRSIASSVAVVFALCAVLVFTILPRDAFDPDYTSQLVTSAGEIRAEVDPDTSLIRLEFLGTVPVGKDLELWVISPEQAPVSLGLIKGQTLELPLTSEVLETLSTDSILAISLEPQGGSPEAGPTGEVLATDPLKEI